jgi:Fur family ferric uptake transcriptional regulator
MTNSIPALLQSTLKQHGYSLTQPRQIVFSALQNQEPKSMSEIVKACKNIDRASVYRTIALFEKLGVIRRLQMGWKYKLELSDAFSHHHHHLTCTKCGKVITIRESSILEKQLNSLASAKGFQAQDHQLEIRGLCKTCQ